MNSKKINLGPEKNLILSIVKTNIYKYNTTTICDFLEKYHGNFHWFKFMHWNKYHELMPMTYVLLKNYSSLIPYKTYKLLKANFHFTQVHNQILWDEFLHIAHSFHKSEIIFIPLKGIAFLCDEYPNSLYRPMADIDLLINKKDLPKAENLLLSLNYIKNTSEIEEKYWKEKHYHVTLLKKVNVSNIAFTVSVEIHWDLDFKRRQNKILTNFWGRLQKKRIEDYDINLLSTEDNLFAIALHARHFGRVLCIKYAYDVARILYKCKEQINWDYILKESKNNRLSSALYFILAQAYLLLDSNVPFSILKRLNIPRWKKRLIDKFILSYTFSEDILYAKRGIKNAYLKKFFLLFDNLWEPFIFIFKIPQEQFARFYDLPPYTKRTNLFYRCRIFYIIWAMIQNIFRIGLYPKHGLLAFIFYMNIFALLFQSLIA